MHKYFFALLICLNSNACEIGFQDSGSLFKSQTVHRLDTYLKDLASKGGPKIQVVSFTEALNGWENWGNEQEQLANDGCIRVAFLKKPLLMSYTTDPVLIQNKMLLPDDLQYARQMFSDISQSNQPNSIDAAIESVIAFYQNAYFANLAERKSYLKLQGVTGFTRPFMAFIALIAGCILAILIRFTIPKKLIVR